MTDAQTQQHFHFRIVPFIVAVLLTVGLPYIAQEVVDSSRHYSHLVPGFADRLRWLVAHHTVLLVLALIAIAIAKAVVPGDYGLHSWRDRSCVGWALVWGVGLGVLLFLADNLPHLIAHTAPKLDYTPASGTALGWLGYHGGYAALTEEIPFRALIVSYLALTMPGKWRVATYEMNAGGVIAAIIYAFYSASFLTAPFTVALGEFIVQFAFGVAAAYWLEKSRSIVAPIVGHGAMGAVSYGLMLGLVTLWG